jgi:hypothetical protein
MINILIIIILVPFNKLGLTITDTSSLILFILFKIVQLLIVTVESAVVIYINYFCYRYEVKKRKNDKMKLKASDEYASLLIIIAIDIVLSLFLTLII